MSRIKLFKNGFTLAEILITLGVVGVVAAMTLPSVINHYKKTVTEKQLKLAYNLLANGFKLAEIDNGDSANWVISNTDNIYFKSYIEPYFQAARICANPAKCGYKNFNKNEWIENTYTVMSNENRLLFQIKNGIVVFFPLVTTDKYGNIVSAKNIYIDINGPKGPNKFAKDVFNFQFVKNKGLIPLNGACNNENRGGCAYYIMQNGWKIPDDYPVKL